ncbi:protein of unknown function [Paraburkholderia kururiensis]
MLEYLELLPGDNLWWIAPADDRREEHSFSQCRTNEPTAVCDAPHCANKHGGRTFL